MKSLPELVARARLHNAIMISFRDNGEFVMARRSEIFKLQYMSQARKLKIRQLHARNAELQKEMQGHITALVTLVKDLI